MFKKTKIILENIFFNSRYFILLAVITTMFSSIFLFIWNILNFIDFIKNWINLTEKEIVINIIWWIDIFFLWIITLIISFSLYEIYIKSDLNVEKINLPKSLVVCSLDELKAKLTSVVLIILIITYFKYSISLTYNSAYELLAFAIWIFFISLSIYMSKNKK